MPGGLGLLQLEKPGSAPSRGWASEMEVDPEVSGGVVAWPNITSRCCFMLRGRKINGNPLHPIHSTNFVSVRLRNQAFKPLHFRHSNDLTLSASSNMPRLLPRAQLLATPLLGRNKETLRGTWNLLHHTRIPNMQTAASRNPPMSLCPFLKPLPEAAGFGRGAEEVLRWDTGQNRPCF